MTNDQLTIVVVPDGELGHDCQRAAEAWTRAGLLRSSVWVEPAGLRTEDSGPARVTATHVTPSSVDQADLFTLVGRRRLSLVRLIVVHPGVAAPQDHESLSAVAIQLSELLRSALPLGTSDSERGTELHRVKLVVPANGVTDIPQSVLQPDWEVNAVVSPEDRPDVDRGSIFVREDANFVGHLVNAVSAVGGLWDGMPAGALDGVTTDSTTSEGWLHVLRPTARAVLADDRAEGLLEQAASVLAVGDVVDHVDWGRRASDPAHLVSRAASALLGSKHWVTPEVTYGQRRGRERRSAGTVAGQAFRYNMRLFVTGWKWMVRKGEQSVEHVLTGQLVGHESDISVALRPETPASLTARSRATREAEDRTVGEILRDEGLEVNVTDPSAWRDLRRVAFALVDGGQLPEGVRSSGTTSLVEVVPRTSVSPPRHDVLESGAGPVGLVDAEAYRHELARLEAAVAAEVGRAEADGDADEEERDEAAASRLATLREQLVNVREWGARRQDSLLWLVATDVAHRLDGARSRRATLESLRHGGADDPADALATAYGRLVTTWRLAVVLGILGAAWLVWEWLQEEREPREILIWAGVGLLGLILVVAWANHRYFKADLKYRRDSAEATHQRRAAAEELVTVRRHVHWLSTRYRGLMLWAPILAEIIHSSLGTVPKLAASLGDDDIELLPAAVALGARDDDRAAAFSPQTVTDVIDVLHPEGYVSLRWEGVLADFLHDSGRGTTSGASVVDMDELETQASPRRELLAYLLDHQSTMTQQMLVALHDAIRSGEVRLPAMQVRRIGPYSDGLTVTDEEFYRASLKAATPFTLDLWTPEGLQQSKHLLQKSIVWMPVTDGLLPSSRVDVRSSDGRTAVRVDLSGRCYVDHVQVFAEKARQESGPAWRPEDIDDFN